MSKQDKRDMRQDATPNAPPEAQGKHTSPARKQIRRRRALRVAYDAVLTALALALFVVELQIPLPLPIPGVKLGLSNIVSLFAMFALGPVDAAVILLARIGLGSLFAGSVMSLLYSLAGGALCYAVTLLLYRIVTAKQIWVAGIFGAVSHVAAQVAVAAAVTDTWQVFYYLPILVAVAIATGALTGMCAQLVHARTARLLSRGEQPKQTNEKPTSDERQDEAPTPHDRQDEE